MKSHVISSDVSTNNVRNRYYEPITVDLELYSALRKKLLNSVQGNYPILEDSKFYKIAKEISSNNPIIAKLEQISGIHTTNEPNSQIDYNNTNDDESLSSVEFSVNSDNVNPIEEPHLETLIYLSIPQSIKYNRTTHYPSNLYSQGLENRLGFNNYSLRRQQQFRPLSYSTLGRRYC